MNYLGHFYLAYPDPMLVTGNLLGEYVHGQKAKADYSEPIWEGIMMHRYIDSYTDAHPSAHRIADFFRADFQKYAPVMSDIAIDYLLATDTDRFSTLDDLHGFAENVYEILLSHTDIMPEKARQLVVGMSTYDWLTQYRQIDGITKAFGYIISRSTYLEPRPSTSTAVDILVSNETELRTHYQLLMADLDTEF